MITQRISTRNDGNKTKITLSINVYFSFISTIAIPYHDKQFLVLHKTDVILISDTKVFVETIT